MKDGRKLKEKLDRLGGATDVAAGRSRTLSAADPDGLIAAILREIDDTMLGRELDFRNERGELIGLDVSGRRLLRVRAVSPDALGSRFGGYIDVPVSDPGDKAVRSLLDVLKVFADGTRTISVEPRKLSRRPKNSETGCAAEGLSAAWSLALSSSVNAAPGDPIEAFLVSCKDLATSWIMIDGDKTADLHGDQARVRHLVAIAAEGIDLPPCSDGSGAIANCIIFRGADNNHEALLYAEDSDLALIMTFPNAHLARIMSLWQRLAKSPGSA
ncbi:MAG: hypothetical protein WCD16_02105 [Paracoccaceae bacterium]